MVWNRVEVLDHLEIGPVFEEGRVSSKFPVGSTTTPPPGFENGVEVTQALLREPIGSELATNLQSHAAAIINVK